MKIILTQFSAYHLWANQLIVDCIKPLPQEQKIKEIESSFNSLTKTLLHMWDAESIWWQRIKLQEKITRPSDGFKIPVIGIPQHLKPLMDKDIVYKEIGRAIGCDAYADPKGHIPIVKRTKRQADDSRNGKDEKEKVISFKKAWLFLLMVVSM